MTYSINLSRPALTAIAAVLAASATPAFAQEVTPDPATSSTTTATTPPVTEPVAGAPETAPAPTASEPTTATTTADPLAPAAPAPVVEKQATKTTTPVRRTATRAAPPTAASTLRTAPPTPSTASASTSSAAVAPPAPVEQPLATPTPAAPALEPAPAPQAAAENDMLPIAGAGAAGLLALAGAGVALSRRRRRDEDEVVDTVAYEEPRMVRHDPVVDTPVEPVAATSAFQWGDRPATPAAASAAMAGPGSHLEAARRGPTPENPFLSLKKRLKRASFFEQRDRLVAQGRAKPVARTAGLPAAMSKAVRQVRDSAMRPVNAVRQPMNLSFNQRYQPA